MVLAGVSGSAAWAARNPLNTIPAESFDSLGGQAKAVPGQGEGKSLWLSHAGDFVLYKQFDFDSGVAAFQAQVAASNAAVLEVRLDAPTGVLLGTCALQSTGGDQVYKSVSCKVDNSQAGVRDICLLLRGPDPVGPVSVKSFQFLKTVVAAAAPLRLGAPDRVDAPSPEPQATNAWGMPERGFADDFETDALKPWVSKGMTPTRKAIAGGVSILSSGTNLHYAFTRDVYINQTDTGGEWRSLAQAALSADLVLDAPEARAGIGFAAQDGRQWVEVTLNPGANTLEARRHLADGSSVLVHRHPKGTKAVPVAWKLQPGVKYRLQVDWSPYSGGLIAFLYDPAGAELTSFRTVIDLPAARRPLLVAQGGEARFDNVHFDPSLDSWNLKWQWKKTPVLAPDVCNPAVWKWKDGKYYMMWRKFGADTYHGIATSTDAINWTRVTDKVLKCTGDMNVLVDPFGDGLVYVTPGGNNMPWWTSDGSSNFTVWTQTRLKLGSIHGNSRIQEIIDTRQYPQLKPVEFAGQSYRFIGFTENWVAKPQPHTVVMLSDTLTNWVVANPEPLIPPGNQFWGEKGNAIGSAFVLPNGNILISSCSCTFDGYTGASEPSNVTAIVDGRQPWKLLRLGTLPDAPVSRESVWYQGPNFGTAFFYEPNNDTLYFYGGFHDYYIGMMRVEHFSLSKLCR